MGNVRAREGIIAGILSSLCCILPPILIAMGIGSVAFAFSLSQYRPVFIAMAMVFFSISIYRKYSGCKKCGLSQYQLMKKEWKSIALSLAIFVVVSAFLTYVIAPAIARAVYPSRLGGYKSESFSSDLKSENAEFYNRTLTLKIAGMTCEGCAYGIQAILSPIDGVYDAKVYFGNSTAVVIFDDRKISENDIISAIPAPYKVSSYSVK